MLCSSTRGRLNTLPHEHFFGFFLVVTWLRLVLNVGLLNPHSVSFMCYLAGAAALVHRCSKSPTDLNWRIRLIYYAVLMNIIYWQMRAAVPLIHPVKEDLLLQQLDNLLIGGSLSLRLERWVSPLLTEIMSLCYILFMPYLMFSLISYATEDIKLCRRFYAGLFSLYGIGFLGYTLLPALGPYLATPDKFSTALSGFRITGLNASMVLNGSNRVDVFPSLHCAVSAYMLLFDRRHKRWRFKLYLLPCLGLWISTLYLRYHYFVDVVFGFALAAFALHITERCQPE